MIRIFILLAIVGAHGARVDTTTCGLDPAERVYVGGVSLDTYPWYGVLYYAYRGDTGDMRSVTPVVLIHEEFVLACAADIGPMPKLDFSDKARVLLGEGWEGPGRRVKSYVIHPEYGSSVNAPAVVELAAPARRLTIKPVCPPPNHIRNPEFYVLRFEDDFNILRKQVIPVVHVPGEMCKDFYQRANLYGRRMRPRHVACATTEERRAPCVWAAGSALAMRDAWGRWQLLGLGVRGPGCGAPARFLDLMSYQPWLRETLERFQPITISRIDPRTVVFRQGIDSSDYQKFGDCDNADKQTMLYRDFLLMTSTKQQMKILDYKLDIFQAYSISCLRAEVLDGAMQASLEFKHLCPRKSHHGACYSYKESFSTISMKVMYTGNVAFEVVAFGVPKKRMRLLDKKQWKLEEGRSFFQTGWDYKPSEYRGLADDASSYFGFDPLVPKKLDAKDRMQLMWLETNLTKLEDTNVTTTTITPKEKLREMALERNKEMMKLPYGYFFRDENRKYHPVYFEYEDPKKDYQNWTGSLAMGWFSHFRNGTKYPAPKNETE